MPGPKTSACCDGNASDASRPDCLTSPSKPRRKDWETAPNVATLPPTWPKTAPNVAPYPDNMNNGTLL